MPQRVKTGDICKRSDSRREGFPDGSEAKNLPASAGDTRDAGSTPASGRSPAEEMATGSSTLVWEISWTEEPGELQSMESQRAGHDRACIVKWPEST